MIKSPRAREKYITLDRFLADDHAMVHIVPAVDGVLIPAHLKSQTTVTLKMSRLFRGSFKMNKETGIEAELLFSNEYFTCKIPFESIWAATSASGQMRMWPEDTPEDILASLAAPVGETSADKIALAEMRQEEEEGKGEDGKGDETKDGSARAHEIPSFAAKSGPASKAGRPALRRIK